MKTILLKTIYAVLAVNLLISFSACEKEMMSYEGKEGIYFAVQHGPSYSSEAAWAYQPFSNFEFVKTPEDKATISLKVMVTGPAKDYDRPYLVEINPDSTDAVLGVHYEALPTDLVIPAGSVLAYVPVTLLRTPDLRTEVKTIGLRLVANEHLELSFPEWDAVPGYTASLGPIVERFDASLHTVRVNDFLVQPPVWVGSIQDGNREAGSWGAFTEKKFNLMCELMDLTYEDFASMTTMPFILINLITDECSRYLIQQYNAGTPVLEADGRLMFVGNVPWTSYIGVPWVAN